jgi:hypothetical protein
MNTIKLLAASYSHTYMIPDLKSYVEPLPLINFRLRRNRCLVLAILLTHSTDSEV